MPSSKYDRELRFIDNEVGRLNRKLKSMVDAVPDTPSEAAKKADEILGVKEKISELVTRKREIEDAFIKAGLDVPNIDRSMNATVHNAGGFEIVSAEEAEAKAFPASARCLETADDVSAEIKGVTDELMKIEVRIAQAEIDDDESEKQKLQMMASSLRERRETLIQTAKQMRAEKTDGPASGPAVDDKVNERIDALEADSRALRSQVSEVRNSLQDVKDQLRQILNALNIEEED